MFYFLSQALAFDHDKETLEFICEVENQVQMLRISQAFLTMLIYFRSLYFLSLVDKISPIIDIFYRICWDIKYFVLVLFILLYMFASCFHTLGEN